MCSVLVYHLIQAILTEKKSHVLTPISYGTAAPNRKGAGHMWP